MKKERRDYRLHKVYAIAMEAVMCEDGDTVT